MPQDTRHPHDVAADQSERTKELQSLRDRLIATNLERGDTIEKASANADLMIKVFLDKN